jgi:hypothetical protein
MQIFIALLIISFIGMAVMLGRKYRMIGKGQISMAEGKFANPFQSEITRLKFASRKGAKRYAYASLFAVLRVYIRSANFLKTRSMDLARKIEKRLLKNRAGVAAENGEKREASRYLKMISEYQRKIRLMKRRIREEENLDQE